MTEVSADVLRRDSFISKIQDGTTDEGTQAGLGVPAPRRPERERLRQTAAPR